MKATIVGCGLSGVVSAILLKEKGYDVEIFETREHIGGNCYDELIDGVCVHKYGPHGFHTDKKYVWDFLNRYTKFNDVALRVWANTKMGRIPVPFNKASEDLIGPKTPEEIRDLVFVDYSEKMWGTNWSEIPIGITSRLPMTRDSFDDRYHLDELQGIPAQGYTKMFENMLCGIKYHLGCSNKDWRKDKCDLLVYTGKIDEYYDYAHGKLEYRSINFEFKKALRRNEMQINECNKKKWTRTVDHSHWLKQDVKYTVISKEFPCEHEDGKNVPFYPKMFGASSDKYNIYKKMKTNKNIALLGRLGTYRYLDMDDTIAQIMNYFKGF